ncbi:SMI1/KNR4 family protein [Kitasatospora sp. NPDC101155]|uniref:SMI1/KNR4 family protein n=1 Tax=Kitasatospora sp. NPDC101155 TaxID=3364097 RepID=UPI00381E341E
MTSWHINDWVVARVWNVSEIRSRVGKLGLELGPTLPAWVVSEFERNYSVVLPKSYRNFLLSVGDGGAGPFGGLWSLNRSYGPVNEEWWPRFLATPFAFTEAVGPEVIGDYDYDEDGLVVGSMIVAEIGCGAFVRLVVTGDSAGKVWFDNLGIDSTLEPGPDFCDWYMDWVCSMG